MRRPFHETARQLRSVAERYRNRQHAPTDPQSPFRRSAERRRISARRTGAGTIGASEHSRDPRLRRLEAVLFLSREPLNTRKLAQLAGLSDGTEARTLLRKLNQRYDESGSAFRVEEVAGGYQLLTRPQFASWLRRLEHVPSETRLSAPALETLAVVAYRQPVLRADIEAVRGVSCGEILRQLMERDLVRIGGRSEELGRPYLYSTTKRFLQTFGLQSLDNLPRAELLRSCAIASATNTAENQPDALAEQPADEIQNSQLEDS